METLSLDACIDDPGESSSVWSHRRRRRLSSATLLDSPVSTFSNHTRGVSSPHLQLRTILPSPSSGAGTPMASGSYFPIAPKTATGVSLASPLYRSVEQASIEPRSPGKHSSGIWSRRASTSTLTAPMVEEQGGGNGTSPSPVVSKAPSTWRHSAGSWAGFFGGKSSRGSGGIGESRVSAEERLKKLLEGSQGAGKGKGKGKGVVGR